MHVIPQQSHFTSNETCMVKEGVIHSLHFSFAVWNTCPQNWTERDVTQKCQDDDQSDFLRNLPVFDKDSHVHYRNIFCARCNGAVNTSFWKLQFNCDKWMNVTTFNFGTDMVQIPQNCWIVKFRSGPHQLQSQLKKCIPRFQDCQSITRKNNGSYCQTECLRYAFPVCSKNIRYRNPQCALCNGIKLDAMDRKCEFDDHGITPTLTILFDFSSTSKYSVLVNDYREYVFKRTEKEYSCRPDEAFDPYADSCKKIVSIESQPKDQGKRNETGEGDREGVTIELGIGSVDSHLSNKHNESHAWNTNCTAIAFNKTEYALLPNGSVYVRPHNKIYSNMTYTIRDSRLLLCVNFSRNFTKARKDVGSEYQISKTPASLELLSSIGCIVSMVSLVLLLITYILFAELRNLTGKIIINLAMALLLYQSAFFSAVKNDNAGICQAVAVLLHFFVLSSFTWMNVMAFDVRRIFTSISGNAGVCRVYWSCFDAA